MQFARGNKRFVAIDRAISQNGLKFVTLLRLSPLLPLALSNYFYGLTSVDLGSYVIGTVVGILPGTYAYVTAGHVSKAILLQGGSAAAAGAAGGGGGGMSVAPWQLAVGVGASLVAIAFIGQIATKAIEEADREADAAGGVADGDQKESMSRSSQARQPQQWPQSVVQ
jgi:hypothetical protein